MFGKKTKYIKLTEKDLKQLKKKLSKSEYKKLEKRIKESNEDVFWDAITYGMAFEEDDL